MNTYKPYIVALCYSFFVGLSFLTTKLVVPHASAFLILAHRFTVSFLVYAFYLILSKKKINFNQKTLWSILPVTLFYPILFFALQVYGLQYASSSEAGIIFATVPIITVVLSALMGHLPSKIQFISIVLSVSGVLIIFSSNLTMENGTPLGILLLFLSAVSASIYSIVVKRVLKGATVHDVTFVIIMMGFLIFNIGFAFEHSPATPFLQSYVMPFYSLNYALGILYLGIFASVITSFSSNYALQHISAPQFSVFSNLSTLISILAGAIILNEPLHMRHLYGISLILIGVIGTNFSAVIASKLSPLLKKS